MRHEIILKHEALVGGELRYKYLLGLEFKQGKTDCYSMLRSVFKDNLDRVLTNYARPNRFWCEEEMNLYIDNYRKEGFKLVKENEDDFRPFDVFLIAIPDHNFPGKTITNHCAIYLNDGIVIHHRFGCMSSLHPYRGALRNLTTHHIRHKDVPDMRNKSMTEIDLMDHILPHKREMLMGALNEHSNPKKTVS